MSSSAADIAAFRFSRADIAGRSGLAVWREVVGRTILNLDLTQLTDHPFHSEATTWAVSGLRITHATKSGLRMERTHHLLADSNDDVGLHIGQEGAWIVSHRTKEATLGEGHAVLVSNAEVATVTCPSLSRCLCIQLPRKTLAPVVPELDDALMRPLRRDNEALRLLVSYVNVLTTNPTLRTPELQHLVASHVRDLFAIALGANRDAVVLAEEGGIRAARLHAIKVDIVQQLARQDLSVTTVAAGQGVSPRYVQMLFESEGSTFSAFVRAQRLSHAHRLLTDSHAMHRSISAIAFDAGFSDLSHFNRAFRRRFGITPSEVRALTMLKSRSSES